MTPQNVIIGAFVFACVIIGSGLIFGGKRHATTARETPPLAALEGVPTPSEPEATKKEATKKEVTKPEPTEPESAPSKSPQPEAAVRESAQSMPIVATYEAKRKRETDNIIARDPKGFWIRQIVTKIEDKKIELSKPLEQPVAVQVEFVIGHDGALLSKTVKKSSGSEEADKTAIAMLEHAQPFPPMPEGLDERELTFNLPVRFR